MLDGWPAVTWPGGSGVGHLRTCPPILPPIIAQNKVPLRPCSPGLAIPFLQPSGQEHQSPCAGRSSALRASGRSGPSLPLHTQPKPDDGCTPERGLVLVLPLQTHCSLAEPVNPLLPGTHKVRTPARAVLLWEESLNPKEPCSFLIPQSCSFTTAHGPSYSPALPDLLCSCFVLTGPRLLQRGPGPHLPTAATTLTSHLAQMGPTYTNVHMAWPPDFLCPRRNLQPTQCPK